MSDADMAAATAGEKRAQSIEETHRDRIMMHLWKWRQRRAAAETQNERLKLATVAAAFAKDELDKMLELAGYDITRPIDINDQTGEVVYRDAMNAAERLALKPPPTMPCPPGTPPDKK